MPTLQDIASLLGCVAPAGGSRAIRGVATLADAGPEDISFLSSEAYLKQFAQTRAAAVIVARRVKLIDDAETIVLRCDDVDLAVAKVLELFAPPIPRPPAGIDPAARIAPTAQVGEGSAIGPFVLIGQRARIGRRCVLHAGVVIGDDVRVGDDCELFPNVVVRERIEIGSRVIIHAGSILGSDGFGYRWDGSKHQKIPQIGTVIVEDDVEIGSCVCIDRAKFSTTHVGAGTKIDNLVQIGHNVQIGRHCILVGQSALAGSVRLGTGVILGGQSAIRDHVNLGDGSIVAACAGVAEDVPQGAVVSGTPALPHRQSLREQAALRRLPDLVVQLRKLQEQVDTLRGQPKGSTPPSDEPKKKF